MIRRSTNFCGDRAMSSERQCGADREDMEPVVIDGRPEEFFIRQGQCILFHTDLDRDFPVTCRANELLVDRIENGRLVAQHAAANRSTRTKGTHAYRAIISRHVLRKVFEVLVIFREDGQHPLAAA